MIVIMVLIAIVCVIIHQELLIGEDSCMYGCDIFDYNRNCFCERYPNGSGVETIPFFGNEFQMDYCNRGVVMKCLKNYFLIIG